MVIRLKKRTSLKLSKLFFLVVGIIVCLKTPVKAQATLTFDIAIRPQASGLTNSEGNTIVRDAFQQPTGLAFSNDGRKVFSSNKDVDGTHECISMMTLSTPYDLRTASLVVDSADPLETKASLTSNNDIITIIKKKKTNRIICFFAQGLKEPSPAEYKATLPIEINKITMKINR